jgi:ankyrin repeat protein
MKHLLITLAAVVLVRCGNPEADQALLDAAIKGNIEAVKQAISEGADVNVKCEEGHTPLHCASLGGHKEIAEILIANGANVKANYYFGNTPLHHVAVTSSSGASDLVLHKVKQIGELLIAEDANVNAKNDRGETPLDWAEVETAELLRKHGGKTGEKLKAEGK